MASYLINSIKNIQNKKYLELGVNQKFTFSSILSTNKVSVDILPEFNADFTMSTDEYFNQLSIDEKFDVIYIDACHNINNLIKDFNNSVQHLYPNGFIFVHDLVPPSEDMILPYYCGDSYKLLHWVIDNYQGKYWVLNEDYGLTCFYNPIKVNLSSNYLYTIYSQFINNLQKINQYDVKTLQTIISNLE